MREWQEVDAPAGQRASIALTARKASGEGALLQTKRKAPSPHPFRHSGGALMAFSFQFVPLARIALRDKSKSPEGRRSQVGANRGAERANRRALFGNPLECSSPINGCPDQVRARRSVGDGQEGVGDVQESVVLGNGISPTQTSPPDLIRGSTWSAVQPVRQDQINGEIAWALTLIKAAGAC